MAEPHPIKFHCRDAPVYGTHCAASNHMRVAKVHDPATPLLFVIDGHRQMKPGMPCAFFVDRKDAPHDRIDAALFSRIGPQTLALQGVLSRAATWQHGAVDRRRW